jgi:sugar phosphate isomerase/epimerase
LYLELSIVTYLPYYDLSTAIVHGADLGFNFFELPGDRPHAWPKDYSRKQRASLNNLLKDRGLQTEIISINGSYLIGPGLCSEDEDANRDILSYVKDLIELGHDFGCSKAIILPGRPLLTTNPRRAAELAVGGLQTCADFADAYGMTVCVENTPFASGLLDTPRKMSQFIKDVSAKNLAVRLDPCHCNVSKTRFDDFCKALQGKIASVGIHDNKGSADEHLPIGQGSVDIRSAVKSLQEAGYTGSLSIEILPFEGWPLTEAEKHIAKSKQIMDGLLA